MAGPYDLSALGANYFKTAQLALTTSVTSAAYTPVQTSAVDVSAGLTQIISLTAAQGETLVVTECFLSNLNTASGTLQFEVEVDGVVVLTCTAAAHASGSAYIIGADPATATNSRTVNAISAQRTFIVRATKPLSTVARGNTVYVKRS